MRKIYPAIAKIVDDDMFDVTFPDFPGITLLGQRSSALPIVLSELLTIVLTDMYNTDKPYPVSTPLLSIDKPEHAFVVMVYVHVPN